MAATLGNITFYANDPHALATFWAAVFGYPPPDPDAFAAVMIPQGLTREQIDKRSVAEDPAGVGPRLYFHHADRPKTQRNRLHLDIDVEGPGTPSDLLEAERERLIGLGARVVRRIDQQWGPARELYYQMQDPEGNEFCLQG